MKSKKTKTILLIGVLAIIMLILTMLGYQSSRTNTKTVHDLGGDEIAQEGSVGDVRRQYTNKEVNVNYDFATSHFDEDLKALDKAITNNKGVVRSSNLGAERDKKSTYMLVRIPRENDKSFEEAVEKIGKLIRKNTSMDELNKVIKDNDLELAAKENELAAYQKLMENAKSIEDITKLQEKISNLITQINDLKSTKSQIHAKTGYTDYKIGLKEMADAELGLQDSPQVVQSVVNAAKESIYLLKLFVVIIATTLVRFWWLILGVPFIAQVVKEYRKNKRQKEEPKEEPTDSDEKKEE